MILEPSLLTVCATKSNNPVIHTGTFQSPPQAKNTQKPECLDYFSHINMVFKYTFYNPISENFRPSADFFRTRSALYTRMSVARPQSAVRNLQLACPRLGQIRGVWRARGRESKDQPRTPSCRFITYAFDPMKNVKFSKKLQSEMFLLHLFITLFILYITNIFYFFM